MADKQSASMRHTMRRIWQESGGSRLRVATTALTGCVNVGVSLLFVWTTKSIVDAAVAPAHTIPTSLVMLLVACLLSQLLLPALRRRLESVAYTRYADNMRRRLLYHMLCERWSGRGAMQTGDAMSRLHDDVATLASLTCATVPGVLTVMLQLAGAFVFLAILDVRMAAAIVFIMPLAMLVSKAYVKRTRRLTEKIRAAESDVHSFLQESLRHRTLLSTIMGADRRTTRFGEMQSDLTGKLLKRTSISIYSNSAVTAGFMTGYTVAFLWCAYGLSTEAVSFGMMTAFLQLVSQVQRPVVDLARRVPSFINASVAIGRVDDILSSPTEDYSAIPVSINSAPGLRLTDVCYRYPDGEEMILNHLTHDFVPGSITCVTGATGVGKSTLLRILLGLVEPTSGRAEIYYDDRQEALVITPGARRDIVYVPQGNPLMCGTIRDNLLLANPMATDEEMRRALVTAAAEFVLELPDGLDTECFEGGGGFSEGQAQRIAIARGLLKQGHILLLDEPTSSLDLATERELLSRLRQHFSPKCTVIMVTHRKAALDYCTDVINL